MIAVPYPAGVFRRTQARRASHVTPDKVQARGLARRAAALLMVVAVLSAMGGNGLLFFSRSPFVLQARATALQARWTEMVAQGLAPSDLAALKGELAGAQKAGILAAWGVLWLPDSSAIVDRWQAQTDAVWDRSLSAGRSTAAASAERLRLALGVEPIVQRKERLAVLQAASTPAEFAILASDWDLEAALVPFDREIAALVGKVGVQSAKAQAIGIVSDPARAALAQAHDYAFELGSTRNADAGQMLSQLAGLEWDIRARIGAATITKDGFGRAARELSQVGSFGVNVATYRARVDADQKSYAIATTVAQFKALTGDLNALIAQAHHAGQVALAAMHTSAGDTSAHVIAGVPFYNQIHPLSCEETATSMGLVHQGLHISQDQILARLGVDPTRAVLVNGRVVRWGNPDKAFVGNVNGSESNYTGQQANPKALVRVLNSYGAQIIEWSEPGVTANVISAQEIYRQVAAGHPVVAYATWDWRWHPIYYYTSEDGNRVPLISPANDHVYLVVGVSATRVLVNDPIRGQYWVSKVAFQASYEFGMAIVLA